MRKKYKMRQEEISILVSGMISHGALEIYNIMKAKSFFSMDEKEDVDEMLIDMSETMLELGREHDNEIEDTIVSRNIFYTLSFILRKIGHEVNIKYNKSNTNRKSSDRFLKLVYINDEPPNMMI